jgi:hypothetical protein
VLKQHSNKSCAEAARKQSRVKATRRKVVLRRHANRSHVKSTRRKFVSRRYANGSRVKATRRKSHVKIACNRSHVKLLTNRRHCTYVTEIMLKQHAKLSRLKKPDNGKRTSEACRETGQRRRKENGTARKQTKKLEHGYK